ncbi:MAG: malto-oligosyltrehalose synthase [Pseudomonadota bacterium]
MALRIPTASYRLQLHEGFGFNEAAQLADYLNRLGISDAYSSPIFQAAAGSSHGYDVLDHDVLNPELGGAAGFEALSAALKAHDLGWIVDFVPNHMGVGSDGNRFWEDVLEHGQASERAKFFDIDWLPPKETLAHKLLLPILPDQYGATLESGHFSLVLNDDAIRLRAGTRTLPLRPQSLGRVLTRLADLLETHGSKIDQSEELRQLAREFSALDEGDASRPLVMESYRRSARALHHRLGEFVNFSGLKLAFSSALSALSGLPGQPESFDFLDELLRAQHYRLSAWRLALEAVNYRRFFDVTELASLRVELPEVFDASHRTLLLLVEQQKISGIRLDHVDGLFDPIGYSRQLAEHLQQALPGSDPAELPVYVVAEKILAPGEMLPAGLRVHGTTGYEFARIATGVLIDQRAEAILSSTYRQFTGDLATFSDHLLGSKRAVLSSLLASDATMLSRALERLAELDRRWRDLSWQSLHDAVIEVIAAFDAYRSYVRPDGTRSAEDEALVNRAVAAAISQNPLSDRGAYLFLRSLLLMDRELPGACEFAMRFQQTTGPCTAKALEDTAFYRFPRNLAENEVGTRPDRFGVSAQEFHAQNALGQSEHPFSLTATSTHDTKRGEDARARLCMLSELPNTWRRAVRTFARSAAKHRVAYEGREAPARSDEYLFYQTLIGVTPFAADASFFAEASERLQAYALKAAREAKLHTSWLQPNDGYETALHQFIAGVLADTEFCASVLRFCRRIDPYAACKAIAQVSLKLCAPGVPDTYQGAEGWHQVLVDPDNRRPVDFTILDRQLRTLDEQRADQAALLPELLAHYADGRIKLFVVSELLRLRRAEPQLFRGAYTALEAGPSALAYGRGNEGCDLICAVTRFPFRITRGRAAWPLGECWGSQRLAGPGIHGTYQDALSGRTVEITDSVALSQLFAHFPVAVLKRA